MFTAEEVYGKLGMKSIFYKNVWMNQTPELIFRKTNFVAAKHMKTFSFPKNNISEK